MKHCIASSFKVKPLIYLKYFQAMGVGLSLMFLFGFVASTVASMLRNLWLTDWSNENANMIKNSSYQTSMSVGWRLGIYSAIGFAEGR